MEMMKRICFIGVFVVAAAFVDIAAGMPSGATAYIDGTGKTWEGYKSYTGNGYDVVLEWAVYSISANPTLWPQVDFPAGDRYIYAYQLFNSPTAVKDVGYLSVLDLGGNPLAQALMHATRSMVDGAGVMTDPNPSTKQGEWKWSPLGLVSATKKSAFLIFSSVYGPTKGSFEVRGPEEEDPGIPEVPEPGTIALLGAASCIFIARRTKKQRSR